MEGEARVVKSAILQTSSPIPEADFPDTKPSSRTSFSPIEFSPIWSAAPLSDRFSPLENERTLPRNRTLYPTELPSSSASPPSLADFVEMRFIPEYVASKRLAGRAHFQAILKHILTPELVNRAFGGHTDQSKTKLQEVPGWPYLDSLRLNEVTSETIQHLVLAATQNGYSTQTAAHIRNVVGAILCHALKVGVLRGTNPAVDVILPTMSRKTAYALALSELTQVLGLMGYPEKEIALFLMLTDMNVAEICGLRWKDLNLSHYPQFGGGFRIPPKTIIISNQSYRGEFGPVLEKRQRAVPIPEFLGSTLLKLTRRGKFTIPDDFVLTSRTGKPVSPDNLTARRLKSIGHFLDMPWLSWNVFRRTQISMRTSEGRRWLKELEKILPR